MTKTPVPRIVAVIISNADLRRALRLRNAPDFFELRLDALGAALVEAKGAVAKLGAPVIMTARHPLEGGTNQLPLGRRRDLLLQFLPGAAYLDIELRSVRAFAPLLKEARARNIPTILSVHDFAKTPARARLHAMARTARGLGAAIFKVATRTDTRAELNRLLAVLETQDAQMRISVMGIGRLGRLSRLESARRGSALNYVHLGRPQVAGQLSLAQMRRSLRQL